MRNLPSYGRWNSEFKAKGVETIGVHTPETDGERVLDNVQRKVKDLGISYPVLVDTDGKNWKRWRQYWWPTVYLIDRRGIVRYKWEGELDWQQAGGEAKMRSRILELLREQG